MGYNTLLLAFPSTWRQNNKNIFGYRVFTCDVATKRKLEWKKVVPLSGDSSGFIMHMGAISTPEGALLYWTDINGSKMQGRVGALHFWFPL